MKLLLVTLLSLSYAGDIIQATKTSIQAIEATKTYKILEDKFWTVAPVGKSTIGYIGAIYYAFEYKNIDIGKLGGLHYKTFDVQCLYNYGNGNVTVSLRYHKEF